MEKIVQSNEAASKKAITNKHHIKIKFGDKSEFNKYSESFVELLGKVQGNETYEVNLKKKTKRTA